MVDELPPAHFTLVGSLFLVSSLMSPQALNPSEAFAAGVAAVRLLPRVDVLVPPEIAWFDIVLLVGNIVEYYRCCGVYKIVVDSCRLRN